MIKGRDKDMNITKVAMQMCECLDKKQLVKETARTRVIRSKDSSVGREENSSPGRLWSVVPTATEFMGSD